MEVFARLLTMADQIIDALPVHPRKRMGLYSQLAALQDALEIYDVLNRNNLRAG